MTQATKKRILLGGSLGRQFGRVHDLAVHSVAESVRALTVLYPEMTAKLRDGSYVVFSGKRNITAEELSYPSGMDVIRIVPVLSGRANKGGVLQIIVGVVLVVAGFFTGGATWGPAMMIAGAGMAISGALMMLVPQSTATESADSSTNRSSYQFNGSVNTEAQGNPVPLAYGEVICGSAVISGGIYSEDRA